ncbi:MAG TPA: acyltransferase, partial [Candidatus Obscuribacterales bacterium]|nr:acyltransferase [Candidatus Obscuribacterales bacterium]
MSNSVRCGLIQTKNAIVSPSGGTDQKTIEKIKDAMLEKTLKLTKEAHEKGVKILCFQE